jgi:RNA polymerase sigma-70 factor (ECF subfamily)
LKTWIYRIALHEAFNQRRWWFRHRGRETSIEPAAGNHESGRSSALKDVLVDEGRSPLDNVFSGELQACVETELKAIAEPYRTTVILRDIEELSYEEIAEVMDVSLGTVKSRLMRGRDALRKRLQRHLPAFGVNVSGAHERSLSENRAVGGQEVEVMP